MIYFYCRNLSKNKEELKVKNRAKIIGSKLMSIITILTLVTYILINFINENKVQAILYRDIYHQSMKNMMQIKYQIIQGIKN